MLEVLAPINEGEEGLQRYTVHAGPLANLDITAADATCRVLMAHIPPPGTDPYAAEIRFADAIHPLQNAVIVRSYVSTV
jgi:hypothetical protein